MGDITAHFSHNEFASKDGEPTPLGLVKNVVDLAINLEYLRVNLGNPIHIVSGYRSPDHNKMVGGAKRSQHLLGKAADIKVDLYSPKEVKERIELMIDQGIMDEGGLGLYDTFVHYDIRGKKVRWNG